MVPHPAQQRRYLQIFSFDNMARRGVMCWCWFFGPRSSHQSTKLFPYGKGFLMTENDLVEVSLENASLADIEALAEKSRGLYEIYKSVLRVTKDPVHLSIDFNTRTGAGDGPKGQGITLDRLRTEAARFRILTGIQRHVQKHAIEALSFTLSFTSSCSVRSVFEPPSHEEE